MSKLLVKPNQGKLVHELTPEKADWQYVHFQVIDLQPGEQHLVEGSALEHCVTILSGHANIEAGNQTWENLGDRQSVFERKNPHAVYVTWQEKIIITAITACEIALSSAPGAEGFKTRYLDPKNMVSMPRGEGSNERLICNILMGDQEAASLLITEVITPSGHWSSYPPHRHDEDNMPEISYLEETYYHRLNPQSGFAFQRVYTDDRSLDEALCVEDRDLVLVPKGYHPAGVPHGYELYYFNTMAGPKREWQFHNDPDHEWIFEQKNS